MRRIRGRRVASLVPPLTVCILATPGAAITSYSQEAQEQFIEGKAFDHICDGYDEEWGNCDGLPECGPCTPSDCIWGQWGEWSYAGGCIGLDHRERRIEVRSNECGKPCEGTKEDSRSHVLDKCKPTGADCLLTAWSEWSQCQTEKDQAMRSRSVEKQPDVGGQPCVGSLKETRPCGGPQKTDCRFGAWQEWTSCSATCGDGRHTRMRSVEQEAHNGGKPCWDALLEAASCSVETCPGQDCELSTWTEWSGCDAGRTQRFRSRQIVHGAVGSGLPCEQKLIETLGCPLPEPEDCKMSAWGLWSECDRACDGGQRYRERQLQAAAVNGGSCEGVPLRAAEACNTQVCQRSMPQDCVMTEWESWTACSATCGKGSRMRARKVLSFATWGGSGCEGGTSEIGECSGEDCRLTDCQWGEWAPWSVCSSSCGGGTKHRTRELSRPPSNGGRACDPLDKGQVAPCSTQPCGVGCVDGVWASWTEWTECSGTCHSAYKSRSRSVGVQPNYCGRAPVGVKEEFVQCTELPPCATFRDCQLSEWEEWSHCSTSCFGIRERNRFIADFAAGGGLPCSHGLKQIEPCNPGTGEHTSHHCTDTPVEDCAMDDWAPWSQCSVTCGGGQMARRRSMLAPSKNGGRPCASDLLVTAPCGTQPCPSSSGCQDCEWGEWSEWSACSQCGGQKYRHRSITRLPDNCGKRCNLEVAKEVAACPHRCEGASYCAWTDWSDAHCSNRCGTATSTRTRVLGLIQDTEDYLFIGSDAGQCGGSESNQSMCADAGPCKTCDPVDCGFAAWGEWGTPSCQGLCERSRIISRMNNECGRPCGGSLLETKHCPAEACNQPKDCVLSDWGPWSLCQTEESGQKYRSRQILQQPANGGSVCQGVLSQTSGCGVDVKAERCRFGAWGAWTACSLTCGIGWHVRTRDVEEPPHGGGLPCRGHLKELQHCKAWDPSVCRRSGKVDCVLGDWGAWSICAGDGQRYRDRQIVQPATLGGEPCEGSVHETETCVHPKVDCSYSAWTEWDRCDQECGQGQKRRQRQIARFPTNGGTACAHELMMTEGCKLKACVIRNATVSEWGEWGPCQSECGPTMQLRSRGILQERDPGGQGFTGTLGESRECEGNPECEITDCEWDDWAEWGACSLSCGGGQRLRKRHIRTYPHKGGKMCEAKEKAHMEKCNVQPCGEPRCEDGEWFEWTAWSPCSASCDGGVTFRSRKIAKMANACGCPPAGKDRETAFCNVDTPCGGSGDCRFSPWSMWEDCSATCDGVKRRERRVEAYGRGGGELCKGALQHTYPCNPSEGEDPPEGCMDGPPRDCILSDWGEWSLCSATCGGGEHIRSRSIKQHPANRGKACEDSLSEIKECARSQCGGPTPTDCKFGNWEEWGECDKCSGERTRRKSILSFPVNGGKECEPTSTSEVGSCPRRCHHPKYCEWEDWGKWTGCSVTCGKGGKRRRRRHLNLSEFAESKMPVLTAYESLRAQAEELESGHHREALAAFAAGCAAVLLALGGVRALSSLQGGGRGLRSYSRLRAPAGHAAAHREAYRWFPGTGGLQGAAELELE